MQPLDMQPLDMQPLDMQPLGLEETCTPCSVSTLPKKKVVKLRVPIPRVALRGSTPGPVVL